MVMAERGPERRYNLRFFTWYLHLDILHAWPMVCFTECPAVLKTVKNVGLNLR